MGWLTEVPLSCTPAAPTAFPFTLRTTHTCHTVRRRRLREWWTLWLAYLEQARVQRAAVNVAITHWTAHTLRGCFRRWEDLTRVANAEKRMLATVAQWHSQKLVVRCIPTLVEHAAVWRGLADVVLRFGSVRVGSVCWVLHTLWQARSWARWLQYCRAAWREHGQMRIADTFYRLQLLARATSEWHAVAHDSSQRRAHWAHVLRLPRRASLDLRVR